MGNQKFLETFQLLEKDILVSMNKERDQSTVLKELLVAKIKMKKY